MSRRITVGLLLAAFLLGACETSEGYRQKVATWYGQHSDELLIEWGPPDSRTELSDGRVLWVYNIIEERHGGGYYDRETVSRDVYFKDKQGNRRSKRVTENYPVWVPPYVTRATCNTHFVVDDKLVVRDVSFHGNACVAPEA